MSVHLIPWQAMASQRLSMARYATGTATEIQTQRDSNPVPTSASQQVAVMRFSSHYNSGDCPLVPHLLSTPFTLGSDTMCMLALAYILAANPEEDQSVNLLSLD